jgi:hypothetical protein
LITIGVVLRREARPRRRRLIHPEHRRRAADGVLDAVENIDHARQLLDGFADLRCPLAEQRRILREQLDRQRLGQARQVADHVLRELDELDVEHRKALFYFLAHVGDDLVRPARA